MGNDKKDLTRIEDLGEFIHELNNDEDFLPDLPSSEDEAPAFEESSLDFGTTEEVPAFGEDSSSTDFGSSETTFDASGDAFNTTEDVTTDFGSTFGSGSFLFAAKR